MARKMKDSGIEWIGEIPEGWEVVKAKYLFAQRNEKGNSALVLLSPTQKYGVIPQSQLEGVVQVKENTDLRAFKTIHIGDFVISLRSFQGGFEFSNYEGVCSPAYQVFHATKDLSNDFFRYLFKSDGFISKINSLTVGIREGKNIQYWDFSNMLLAVPSKEVQIRSAQYLNTQCTEIDTMLSKTRSSIEEYKKLKQAVITQAVTKGVRGEREMKDSGVEWIGKIPKEFNSVQLKFFCKLITDGTHFSPNTVEIGLPYITAGDVHGIGLDYNSAKRISEEDFQLLVAQGCQPLKGDVLLVKDGATTGRVGFVNSDTPCVILSSVAMLRPADNTDGHYLMYLLESDFLQKQILVSMAGSAMPRTTLTKLTKYIGLFPPPYEQKEIADYLDIKCAEIDRLIAKKEQLVKELESYKKSLIYEVVTGKREV
jgi:type I restriction enzyme S subunit